MSLPLCLASNLLNIKIYIFEPNSVLGRANKLILNFAEKIICYEKNLIGISKKLSNKIYLVKPLLRKEIYKYKKNENTKIAEKKKILIIDSIGQLRYIYRYAYLAYGGGGFYQNSLHNILEPAVFSSPVIVGGLYDGFKEAEDLVDLGGVISVKNSIEFSKIFREISGMAWF